MPDTLTAARQYLAAGFSLIPIKADGSKAPAISEWKPYQSQRPTEAQLERWFGTPAPRGIGLVWGEISGHGEALDFDAAGLLYGPFVALCREQGLGDILKTMPLVETPTGGFHLLYRCSGPVSGNQKLAQRRTEDKGLETLIETRGEGGYTLAPGSPPACHPANRPYCFQRGGPDTLPTLTPEDRQTLLALAATLTQHVEPARVIDAPRPRTSNPSFGLRPGDDYNQRDDWPELLARHGWRQKGAAGDKGLWQRPGKTGPGLSATSNYAGSNLFYVFSANAAPLMPQRAYSPFALFAHLEHGGDFSAAAAQLSQDGYGQSFVYSLGETMPAPELTAPPTHTRSAPSSRKPLAERIIDLADVQPPGPLPRLFGDYLLAGSTHWLTGQTGIGKSTFTYNLACALAEGEALWGHPCLQSKLLYLDMENGEWGRSKKVERLYQNRPRVRGHLFFMQETIRLPDELAELLDYVQANGIELVIFDTARRCFSVKDENDNAEFYARIVPTLDGLKRAGIASLVLGHPAKNGTGGARGAQAQEDAGDVNLTLTMQGGAEVHDKDGVIVLRVTKNRVLGLGVEPLYLKRIGDDQFEAQDAAQMRRMTDDEKPETKQDKADAAILDHLIKQAGKPVRHTDIVKYLTSEEMKAGTIKPRITALQEMGKICHDLTGGYILAEGGYEG